MGPRVVRTAVSGAILTIDRTVFEMWLGACETTWTSDSALWRVRAEERKDLPRYYCCALVIGLHLAGGRQGF